MIFLEFEPSLRETQIVVINQKKALLVHNLFHNTSFSEQSAELVAKTSQQLREAIRKYADRHPFPFYI